MSISVTLKFRCAAAFTAAAVLAFTTILLSCASAAPNEILKDKASVQLLEQVCLRSAQIETPTAARLDDMISRGMDVADLGTQRVFIYLYKSLTKLQENELIAMGVTMYVDSWVPPVGVHTYGFLIADVPISKLGELAAKNFVVKLDTAENTREPQSSPK